MGVNYGRHPATRGVTSALEIAGMGKPSLSEQLRTGAKPDTLTLRQARQLGWTVARKSLALGANIGGHEWVIRCSTPGQRHIRQTFDTCTQALEWIRRYQEGQVRS